MKDKDKDGALTYLLFWLIALTVYLLPQRKREEP